MGTNYKWVGTVCRHVVGKMNSKDFTPTPNHSNFERHLAAFKAEDDLLLAKADEDESMIGITIEEGDEDAREKLESMAYDRFYDTEMAGVSQGREVYVLSQIE